MKILTIVCMALCLIVCLEVFILGNQDIKIKELISKADSLQTSIEDLQRRKQHPVTYGEVQQHAVFQGHSITILEINQEIMEKHISKLYWTVFGENYNKWEEGLTTDQIDSITFGKLSPHVFDTSVVPYCPEMDY